MAEAASSIIRHLMPNPSSPRPYTKPRISAILVGVWISPGSAAPA